MYEFSVGRSEMFICFLAFFFFSGVLGIKLEVFFLFFLDKLTSVSLTDNHSLRLILALLKILVAEVMIYSENFTLWTETT